jgi:VWFA-related protein
MKRSVVIVVSFVAFVFFVVYPSAQVFRSGVYTVQVSVTVVDANGRLVTGLGRDDFEVFEDGERQPITQFTDQRVPVSLGVMLDASDSMRGQAMVDARLAVDRFVAELLEAGDQAFVGAFNHRPRILVPWTMPPSQLRSRLDDERPTGGTAMYDALAASAPMFARRQHARAAMVVISDGADTASSATLAQARDALRRTDAFLYGIAIDDGTGRAAGSVNVEALRELTGQMGGYTEVVRSAADVGPATERIARELDSQYTLGYTTPKAPDGTWRLIRVRMTAPGRFARARRGYFAFSR